MKKCLVCGKRLRSRIICEKCVKDVEIFKKILSIKYCNLCNTYFFRNKSYKKKNFIKNYILKKIISRYKNAIILDFNLDDFLKSRFYNNKKKSHLYLIFKHNDSYYSTKLTILIELKHCSRCSVKQSHYFEASILVSKKIDQKIIDFIKKYCKKNEITIAKIESKKNEIIFKLQDWRKAQKVVNQLVEQFSGYVKTTRKIYSRDKLKSKDIYRVTFNYIPFSFKKYDIIKINNKYYYVLSMSRTVKLLHIDKQYNLKKDSFKVTDLINKNIITLKKKKAQLITRKPLMIMLENYETKEVENIFEKYVKLKNEVYVVKIFGKYFIVY